MNYTDYPPGLQRRLRYGKYIQSIQNNSHNSTQSNSHVSSISQYYSSIAPIHINLPDIVISNNFSTEFRHIETDSIVEESYETLVNLTDVSKGIISKNLLNKSRTGLGDCGMCSICRENINLYEVSRLLFCMHSYHLRCIDTWFTENKTCPICRYEI